MPYRVQLKRLRGWQMPANTIKVCRPTLYGNPFIVGKHGDNERCVALFIELMRGRVCISKGDIKKQAKVYEHIQKNLPELKGKNLACWCPITKDNKYHNCHADVLLAAPNDIGLDEIQHANIKIEETIADVYRRLYEYYSGTEARIWLHSPHPQLDNQRPIDLIYGNRTDEVISVINRLNADAYL